MPPNSPPQARVYIAGPMSGLPGYNYAAFNNAAAHLRAQGYRVENPAENPVPSCKTWAGYMRMAVRQLAMCDKVALLPDWETSRGASVEHQLAHVLGISVVKIETLLGSRA